MITAALLLFAALLAVVPARWAGSGWADRAPRVAVLTWLAASAAAVGAAVLAGLTLLVPAGTVSAGLAAVLDACAMTIAGAYGAPWEVPGTLAGLFLAGLVPLRLLAVAARSWLRDRTERRRLRASLLAGARADPALGAHVIDSDRAAAFCLPGRRPAVFVTSVALDVLSPDELAGVLAHERAHLRGRHHVAVAAARILGRAFPGVPLFRRAATETERLVELLADDVAGRRVDRVEVASALVTLAGMRAPRTVLAAAQGAGALRVTRLLRPADPLGVLPRLALTATALLLLAGPVVLASWPLLSAASSGLCVLPGAGWS